MKKLPQIVLDIHTFVRMGMPAIVPVVVDGPEAEKVWLLVLAMHAFLIPLPGTEQWQQANFT